MLSDHGVIEEVTGVKLPVVRAVEYVEKPVMKNFRGIPVTKNAQRLEDFHVL
jgi:hypothetical protein